jgi:hypothetical protein
MSALKKTKPACFTGSIVSLGWFAHLLHQLIGNLADRRLAVVMALSKFDSGEYAGLSQAVNGTGADFKLFDHIFNVQIIPRKVFLVGSGSVACIEMPQLFQDLLLKFDQSVYRCNEAFGFHLMN